MKKRFLSIILSICMVLVLLPTAVFAGDSAVPLPTAVAIFTVSNESDLIEAFNKEGMVVLSDNITLTKGLNIGANKEITLDLNGKTLTYTGSSPAIAVEGEFTLQDSGSGGKIALNNINKTENTAAGVKVTGTFNLTGGTITGGETTAKYSAGGVYVDGTFNMTGGRIEFCSAIAMNWNNVRNEYTAAGGVYVTANGTFTLKNATLFGCSFDIQSSDNESVPAQLYAGGVVNRGNFIIDTGGQISQSFVYLRSTTEKEYIYTKGLGNAGTVHANSGSIYDGIHNIGTIVCDSGKPGTYFYVLDDNVNNVIESQRQYAKHYNAGEINGGVFRGAVHNAGAICGGTFESSSGGYTSSVVNNLAIGGGTFTGSVINNLSISEGIFTGTVENYTNISGGTFTGTVLNKDNVGGLFSNSVSGGTFTGATRTGLSEISFDLNGGTAADGTSAVATQWRYQCQLDEPDTPFRADYKFLGWYNGEEKWNFDDAVTSREDMTLKAKWEALPKATTTVPNANSRAYDGTEQPLVTGGSASGGTMYYMLGESGTWSTSIPTATDAGTYIVRYYAKGDGTTTGDSNVNSVTVTIVPREVTVSGITANNKFYNGTNSVNLNGDTAVVSGLVEGETVSVTATGAFADKTAGVNKVVNIQSITLSGTNAGNYVLASSGQQSVTSANILKKPVTANISTTPKIYNGTTNADVTVNFGDLVVGEALINNTDYIVSAAFDNANTGKNKTVTATVTLINDNYTFTDAVGNEISDATITAKADISRKPVTAVITVAAKNYDGKNDASVMATIAESELVAGDSITIEGLTGTFNDEAVGTYKLVAVNLTNMVIIGADNYDVTVPKTAYGKIVNDWNPTKGTEYTITEPNSNGWLKDDLTVMAKDNYELSFTNTVSGIWSNMLIGSAEGENSCLAFYVRNKTTGAISECVTMNYNLDKNTDSTGTSGTVSFTKRDLWQRFLNTISFNLLYKDEVTVKATASDALSGVAKIEYAASDKGMILTEVEAIRNWTLMPEKGVGVTLTDEKKFVYFIRVTDNAGNVTYFSTDGAVYDTTPPTISGAENGATYCLELPVTVSDKHEVTVTVNETPVTPDSNGKFTLSPAEGEQRIVVTDTVGNKTEVTVNVNERHTYKWQSKNGQYWQKCLYCDDETDKKDIPEIIIKGADRVCVTQDYKFAITVPEGVTDVMYDYEFANKGDDGILPNCDNGVYFDTITSNLLQDDTSFKLSVSATTTDGYTVSVSKTVQILSEHTGGTADCTHKAKCEVCSEPYGEVNAENHTTLKHTEAKAATLDTEGNMEYWHCEECGKYFGDKDGKTEIKLTDTVIAKLPKPESDNKSPQTGNNRRMALWFTLALLSGSILVGTAAYVKKRRH